MKVKRRLEIFLLLGTEILTHVLSSLSLRKEQCYRNIWLQFIRGHCIFTPFPRGCVLTDTCLWVIQLGPKSAIQEMSLTEIAQWKTCKSRVMSQVNNSEFFLGRCGVCGDEEAQSIGADLCSAHCAVLAWRKISG